MRKIIKISLELLLLTAIAGVGFFWGDPYVGEFFIVQKAYYFSADIGECLLSTFIVSLNLLAVVAGLRQTRRWRSIVFLLLALIMSAVHSAYASVLQRPFELFDLQIAERETVHAMDAVRTYQGVFTGKWTSVLACLGALLLVMRLGSIKFDKSFYVLGILALVFNLHFFRHPDNARPLSPSIFTVPVLYFKNLTSPRYYGPRDELPAKPPSSPKARSVVLIVDESIRGDHLSINGYDQNTTPFLAKLLAERKTVNFGLCSSATNCSAPSHLILRTGTKPEELPDPGYLSFRRPSIFQYARNAGYKTALIEGQRRGGKLHDYLTRFDLDAIDSFRFLNRSPHCERSGDCFLVDEIAELIKSRQPFFIYAVKEGAHVPYQKNYPKSHEIFSPALSTDEGLADYSRAVNTYDNALRWVCDDFFSELLPRISGEDYPIVYTSDHGQSIMEGSSIVTHCTKTDPAPSQGVVPLLIFPGSERNNQIFSKAAQRKFSQATQFEIFPTLLQIMGYDEMQTQYSFGPSLLEPETLPQRFFFGDVLGQQKNNWKYITPK